MNIKQFFLVISVTCFPVVFAMKNDENQTALLAGNNEVQIMDLAFIQADEETKISLEETNKKLAKEIRVNRFQAFLNNPSARLKELQKLLSELPD